MKYTSKLILNWETYQFASSSRWLPSEYQEVEYINNGWTAYINLWIQVKDWYRFVSKLRATASEDGLSDWARITGAYIWCSGDTYYRLYVSWPKVSKWSYWYLNQYWNWALWTFNLNTDYNLDFSWISWDAYIKVDGTTLFSSSDTYSTSLSYECELFKGNSWTHPWLTIYSAKYYNASWVLVRDLVPCYRILDNVIWMYDTVNDVFYTNSWTWTFTKWWNIY